MKKLFTVVLVLFIAVSISNAQGIKIGATGGLTLVQGPDAMTKDIADGGAGFSSAPHFGVKGRFSLPLIPIAITGQVLYTKFTGDGNLTPIAGGPSVAVETESSLLIFGVGAEYSFVPGPISPYLGFDVFYANSGDMKISSGSQSQTFDGANRTGIGLGAGLKIGIIPLMDIDVSAKYNINNLLGKEDGEETLSTVNLSATVFFGF